MNPNTKYHATARALLFGMGLLLSCSAFAAPAPKLIYATTQDLSNETNARITADSDETSARKAADALLLDKIKLLPDLPKERFQATLKICGNSDIPQWERCIYAVGETGPAGGKVFYLTDASGMHGLEAAPVDQGARATWGCDGLNINNANHWLIGEGAVNTASILASCSEAGIAARLAGSYVLNGFNDWFLPSKDELSELYKYRAVVGGFSADYYWSSTMIATYYANCLAMTDGSSALECQKSNAFRVRAIRAF